MKHEFQNRKLWAILFGNEKHDNIRLVVSKMNFIFTPRNWGDDAI